MHVQKTIKMFVGCAAVVWQLAAASPAWAELPEISLDTFAPGIGSDVISLLNLQAKEGSKELLGPVAWDGHELAVCVRMEEDKVAATLLQGAQDNGLKDMFTAEMSKRDMLPAMIVSDGVKTDLMRKVLDNDISFGLCGGYAEDVMRTWAADGKKELRILYLPKKLFLEVGFAMHDSPEVVLNEAVTYSLGFDPNLVPIEERMAFGLILSREDDKLGIYICPVQLAGTFLAN